MKKNISCGLCLSVFVRVCIPHIISSKLHFTEFLKMNLAQANMHKQQNKVDQYPRIENPTKITRIYIIFFKITSDQVIFLGGGGVHLFKGFTPPNIIIEFQ